MSGLLHLVEGLDKELSGFLAPGVREAVRPILAKGHFAQIAQVSKSLLDLGGVHIHKRRDGHGSELVSKALAFVPVADFQNLFPIHQIVKSGGFHDQLTACFEKEN